MRRAKFIRLFFKYFFSDDIKVLKSAKDIAIVESILDEIEQLAAARNHGQKAAAGRKVLFVRVEVVGEVMNALSKQCDLIRCAAGVAFVELIILGIDFFGAHGRRGWIQPWPGRPCLVGGADERCLWRQMQEN